MSAKPTREPTVVISVFEKFNPIFDNQQTASTTTLAKGFLGSQIPQIVSLAGLGTSASKMIRLRSSLAGW